jgi:hypothetical protein
MSSVDYIRNITPPYLDKKNHGLAKVHLFDDGAVATYKDVQRIKVWTNGALKAQEVTLDGNGLRMCHDNVFAVRGDKKALLRYNLTDHSTSSLHAPSTISNYVILTKYALVLLQDGRVIKAKRGNFSTVLEYSSPYGLILIRMMYFVMQSFWIALSQTKWRMPTRRRKFCHSSRPSKFTEALFWYRTIDLGSYGSTKTIHVGIFHVFIASSTAD